MLEEADGEATAPEIDKEGATAITGRIIGAGEKNMFRASEFRMLKVKKSSEAELAATSADATARLDAWILTVTRIWSPA